LNALVAKDYTSNSIAEKMIFVINNQEEAKRIGENGYKTGKKFFNSWSYKEELKDFIYNVLNKD